MQTNSADETPIEVWIIDGIPRTIAFGSRILDRLRLAECAAMHLTTQFVQPAAPLAEQPKGAPITPIEAIEYFYRRRKIHRRLTFRQHLKDLGMESRERYIRNVKVRYDKQHRRKRKM